jgi:hypothetical protein
MTGCAEAPYILFVTGSLHDYYPKVAIAPLKSEPWRLCKDDRRDGRIAPLPAPYCSHGSVQHLSVVQTRQLANPLHDLRSFFYARLTSDFFLKLGFD